MSHQLIRNAGAALVAALVLALAMPVARAEDEGVEQRASEDVKQRASEHIERGRRQQAVGNYDQALSEYKAAYDLIPHPLLLYNIATAYRLKGDKRNAVRYYEQYIAIETMGTAVEKARAYLSLLKEELRDTGEPTMEADDRPTRAGESDEEREPAPVPAAVVGTGPRDDGGWSRGRTFKVSGIASAAVGGILLGLGVKFGLDARDIERDIARGRDQWTDDEIDRLEALQADGEAAERNLVIATSIGAAALVGGGVLYYLGVRSDREAAGSVALLPSISSGSAQVSLSLRF